MVTYIKRILTTSILFALFGFQTYAQQVLKYEYDESGNRLSRKVILLSSKQDQTRQDKSGQESINELMDTFSITIYPNPTRENLTISTQSASNNPLTELMLYNTQGKLLYKDKNNNNTNTINMSMYDKGIYLLIIMIEGNRKEFKVIKQ